MGNGSCCSGYSTVDEVKIESIHAPSTRRQQHEVAEESFMQEISIEISPLKSKDKTQEDCREKTSDYTIEKAGGVSKFQRVKVLSASKNLVRDKNGGMKLLSIIQKSAVGNICEYSRCVKALQGGSGEGLYTPDEVFEDNFKDSDEAFVFLMKFGKSIQKVNKAFLIKFLLNLMLFYF